MLNNHRDNHGRLDPIDTGHQGNVDVNENMYQDEHHYHSNVFIQLFFSSKSYISFER